MKKIIGLTMGDPSGIGPEIIVKLIVNHTIKNKIKIFGDMEVLFETAKNIKLYDNFIKKLEKDFIEIVDHHNKIDLTKHLPNKISGEASAEYIKNSCIDFKNGGIDALVTAPISKEAWKLAGINYSGHTEFLAKLFNKNSEDVEMIFLSDTFNLILVTRHLSIADMVKSLNMERIAHTIKVGIDCQLNFLKSGIRKISILALNPHGSDSGMFGNEEYTIIKPAINSVKNNPKYSKNIEISGPHPADSFFKENIFDGRMVVALYHDQGLIPFKMKNPFKGINFTWGLPLIRFSVDHGTAFDIAGKNLASEESLKYVVERLSKIIS